MTDPVARLTTALADRYTIERELGAGGMATVYLAQDLKHHRKVAIKVLRPELAAVIGAERFLAEIRTTANLQHPHILALFDSGAVDGTVFYVMPFVEGESLRDRLERDRQLGIADAVRIATEVAGALDYAHRHGVIHRDIKPENILLHDGQALVADFGIALAASRSEGSTRMTETGMSLGTPHYMSPEQAMGERDLDARSDIYALGCVLYEMLTGEPPFNGPSVQAIVAKVMTERPTAPSATRDTVPEGVEDAVLQALAKLPVDRFASAAEFALALRGGGGTTGFRRSAARTATRPGSDRRLVAALGGLTLLAIAAAIWGWSRPTEIGAAPLAFQVHLTPSESDFGFVATDVALTPDGSAIIYSDSVGGTRQLWIKRRGVGEPTPIPGTVEGRGPFVSPDGRTIAFSSGNRLLRIPLDGGSPRLISDSASTDIQWPGAWLDDGTIVFLGAAGDLIFTVNAEGGPVTRILDGDDFQNNIPVRFSAVPGRREVLVTSCSYLACANPRVYRLRLDPVQLDPILPGSSGAWALDGHRVLNLLPDGSTFIAPYDPATGEVGVDVPAFGGVSIGPWGPDLVVNREGTVLHLIGGGNATSDLGEFVVIGREGEVRRVDSAWSASFLNNTTAELSPDGRRVVFSLVDPASAAGDGVIYTKPFPVGPATPFSFDGTVNVRPVWSPDGRKVAWLSNRDGKLEAWQRNADGSGEPERIAADARNLFEIRYSPDGQWLLYRTDDVAAGRGDIFARRVTGDTTPVVVAATDAEETSPAISPDGRWVAFTARIGTIKEIVVRPFPEVSGGRVQVSVGGGTEPVWAGDSRHLYFRQATAGRFWLAELQFEGGLRVLERTLVSETVPGSLLDNDDSRQYSLMPDGSGLLVIRRLRAGQVESLNHLMLREHALPTVGGSQ